MPKFEFSKLEERYKEIPDEVRDAISSVELAKKLQEIGLAHHLHIDQIEILGENTGLVMLGLLSPTKFNESIREDLNLDPETANKITGEINQHIFLPIRDHLHESGPSQPKVATDFFEKKMSHLFTSTADLRADRGEDEEYTPPSVPSEVKAPLAESVPADKKRPDGMDPYREMPL